MNELISWLLENVPWLGLLLVAMMTVGLIVWAFAKLYFKRFIPMEEKTRELPCAANKASIDELKAMRITVDTINEQVSEISQWIMKKDAGMIAALARKHSPLRMVRAGRTLFEISGARKAIDENIGFLLDEMAKRAPGTPYDVEDTASLVLFSNLSNKLFNGVKNYIYYAPSEITLKDEDDSDVTVPLSLGVIIQLMTIELRDRYLAAHPEVPQRQDD